MSLDPAVASEYKAVSLDVLRPEARISLVDKDGNPILPAEEEGAEAEPDLYVVEKGRKIPTDQLSLPLRNGALRVKLVTTRLSSSSVSMFRIAVDVSLFQEGSSEGARQLRGLSRPFRCVSKILRTHFEGPHGAHEGPGIPRNDGTPSHADQLMEPNFSGRKRPHPEASPSSSQGMNNAWSLPWTMYRMMPPQMMFPMMSPQMAAALASQQVQRQMPTSEAPYDFSASQPFSWPQQQMGTDDLNAFHLPEKRE